MSSFYFAADDLIACRSQGDLASLFRVSLSRFRFHLYSDLRPKYRLFEIPKTSGGFRTIHAPPTLLKYWQELLLHGIESKYSPKPSVHGFIAERSVLTNARMHIKKHIVLNLDLLDFFSSIHFGRVRGLFQSHPFNLNWEVASTLAQMCTYEGVLPQGAPTSPVISNFVCRNLDRELWRLAARGFCSYSRYADDITFSTNQKTLPSSILEASMPMDGVPRLGSDLTTILEKNGFSANLTKTRVQSSAERQMVTGLIVNNRANLPRKFAREIRAIFFNIKTSGYVAAEDRFHKILQNKKNRFSTPLLHASLQGKLSYLRMIRGRSDPLCSSLEITGSKLVRQLPPAVLRGDSTRIPAFHEEALWVVIARDRAGDVISSGTAFYLSGIGFVGSRHIVEDNVKDERPQISSWHLVRGSPPHDEFEILSYRRNPKFDLSVYESAAHAHGGFSRGYEEVRSGQPATVLGYPSWKTSADRPLYLETTVSQFRTRSLVNRFSVGATLHSGASGGPVLNDDGEVTGVVMTNFQDPELANGCISIVHLEEVLNSPKVLL